MIKVNTKELMEAVYNKFKMAGVPNEQAGIVTDLLIYADIRGIHSHGVLRVEHYIERIKAGGINLNSEFNIEEKKPSFALMDADGGFGHVATQYAMEWALETVEKQGIALIGIKNNSHAGALGYYNKMAIDRNKVSLIMVNTDPCVIPFGGKRSFFGTNPISYGFPAKKDFILGDMATSEVSLGRIFTARENNETVPMNWGVDENGNPSSNPHEIKYVVPFGGVKGYLIMTMVEAFTGLLIGQAYCNNLVKMYGDMDKKRNLSTFMLVIDPAVYNDLDTYLNTVQSFIDDIRKEPALKEGETISIPGERKESCSADYLKNGIPLSEHVYKYIFDK
ncbi:Ldh family oxidoreductase [Brachyspira hampsonii]|uniref:Lactate dehydrogenase n=1 Tax=Brachyspira hampsonii TaxID=1287055 RepID=A0AAC9TSJ0_9SPIR|nr:Ldh family oxidoreductase [Brachyspira hampsonii]ASJ21310.1 lactate dehydrogenase [Brachyspira hampsonii]ELV04415.1 Malate/L-lactate dehydrogenase [Brachyspira hampsonii 30599]MBW5381299.1 Ldh family oxidoreductase [Brachyspira hampsonii]OEJ18726.1 lactate dehydrogenase [Brachyspira hampsonii]